MSSENPRLGATLKGVGAPTPAIAALQRAAVDALGVEPGRVFKTLVASRSSSPRPRSSP